MKGTDKEKCRYVEVQVCPRCSRPKIRRLDASSGDMTGALAILPPKYVCLDCGWVGRMVIVRKAEIPKNDVD